MNEKERKRKGIRNGTKKIIRKGTGTGTGKETVEEILDTKTKGKRPNTKMDIPKRKILPPHQMNRTMLTLTITHPKRKITSHKKSNKNNKEPKRKTNIPKRKTNAPHTKNKDPFLFPFLYIGFLSCLFFCFLS